MQILNKIHNSGTRNHTQTNNYLKLNNAKTAKICKNNKIIKII